LPIAQALSEHQQAIARLLASDAPDPATLGRLLIEVNFLETQAQTIVHETTALMVSALAESQREQIGHIREAAQLCQIVPAFAALSLL